MDGWPLAGPLRRIRLGDGQAMEASEETRSPRGFVPANEAASSNNFSDTAASEFSTASGCCNSIVMTRALSSKPCCRGFTLWGGSFPDVISAVSSLHSANSSSLAVRCRGDATSGVDGVMSASTFCLGLPTSISSLDAREPSGNFRLLGGGSRRSISSVLMLSADRKIFVYSSSLFQVFTAVASNGSCSSWLQRLRQGLG